MLLRHIGLVIKASDDCFNLEIEKNKVEILASAAAFYFTKV